MTTTEGTSRTGSEDAAGSLARITLFKTLSAEQVQRLDQACVWKTANPGDQILSRDQQSSDVFFIVKGRVRIVNYSSSGREVAYASAEAGQFFGELSAIDGNPRTANVVALDECKLALMPAPVFRDIVKTHSEVAITVMEKLAAIIRASDDRIMDLATLSAYQRVYLELLKLRKPDPVRPSSWLIYPLPTQAQIAASASTTRETVARVLSQLQSEGVTERKSKTLYIRKLETLERLAERTGAQLPEKVQK
ncbi:MAG: cyclic nucleotide-binding domain-containing protein [Alphaproteobacteria bacterium]|nr:cyclic nucleotide-binding domain-containing protein [Alphaproteobacteria bacterium]